MSAAKKPRNKPSSLHPIDDLRLAALEARVRRRMCSVDDAVSRAAAFASAVDDCQHGVVLDPIKDEDSLVIHIGLAATVVRSIA